MQQSVINNDAAIYNNRYMNKVIKKIFRSIMYVVGVVALSIVPDVWLWHIGVNEWPLPLAILWWVPTLLILLAEMGLQLGKFIGSR